MGLAYPHFQPEAPGKFLHFSGRQELMTGSESTGHDSTKVDQPTSFPGGQTSEGRFQHITVPGLCDHHSHTSLYAALSESISFWGVADKDEAFEIIARLPFDELTLVMGWNENLFSFTDAELAMMPPVIITHYSLHGMLMSSAAESMLHATWPDIIDNYRDFDWFQKYVPDILQFLGNISEVNVEKVENHFRSLLCNGIYHVQDMMLVSEEALRVIKQAATAVKAAFWSDPELYERLSNEARGDVRGIKLFTDGALASGNAAVHKPYRGTEAKGLLCYEDGELLELMRRAAGRNLPVALHAIGDRAVSQVLDALDVLSEEEPECPEVRIEHAQFISVKQAIKAKKAGVVLSMQPNFSHDSIDYAEILPDGYAENNNPLRMLIDEAGFVPGKDLLFGSDGMPHGIEAALGSSLFPPFEGQRLSVEEFVAGYTLPGEKNRVRVEIDHAGRRVRVLK